MEGKKGGSLANSIGGPGVGGKYKGGVEHNKKSWAMLSGLKKEEEASYPTYIKQNRKKAGYSCNSLLFVFEK